MNDYTLKCCSKCGEEKPATLEYFRIMSRSNDGLDTQCKDCRKLYINNWHQNNPDKRREYHLKNYEKELEKDREYYRKNRERVSAKNKANRAKLTAYMREWRSKNREHVRRYGREYARRPHVKARIKRYGQLNRAILSYKHKLYCMAKPHIALAIYARRCARKKSLPDTFTGQHWLLCLDYWHNTCAVCTGQLRDLFGEVEPHADHWIPLAHKDCPGTTPDNMICLCNKCNLSKQDKLPDIWLIDKFGKSKARAILDRIHHYFEWIIQF